MNKYRKAIIYGLIALFMLWSGNNFIKMQRYEKVITLLIGSVLSPTAPDNLLDIANKGEISKETADSLTWAYGRLVNNFEYMEWLARHLKLVPPNYYNEPMQTLNNISIFFSRMSGIMKQEELITLELDDMQVKKLLALYDLSKSLRMIENAYKENFKENLTSVRKKHWVNMFLEMSSVIIEYEDEFSKH